MSNGGAATPARAGFLVSSAISRAAATRVTRRRACLDGRQLISASVACTWDDAPRLAAGRSTLSFWGLIMVFSFCLSL